MSLAKRFRAIGHKGPLPTAGWRSSAEWNTVIGTPLPLDRGETVAPSKCPGWVEIAGGGHTRYAPATPAQTPAPDPSPEPPRRLVQSSLFD